MKDEYITKDFQLATALCASGASVKLRKDQTRDFIWFIFENKEKCELLVEKHWKNELIVSSRDFIEAVNMLKTRIHDAQIY